MHMVNDCTCSMLGIELYILDFKRALRSVGSSKLESVSEVGDRTISW